MDTFSIHTVYTVLHMYVYIYMGGHMDILYIYIYMYGKKNTINNMDIYIYYILCNGI